MRLFALIVLLFGSTTGAGNDAHQMKEEFGSRSEGVTVGIGGSGGLELERGARSMVGDHESTSKICAKAGSQCRGHPTVGLCEKLIIGYTFDSVSQKCVKFQAGGCSLSRNGFNSEEECINHCHRAPKPPRVKCHAMPGSSRSDSWCEIHCQGGKHPACVNSSGVHQQCICDDTCTMEKIMRQSGRFSNEGVTVGLQLGLTPPENCEDESIVMKRCDKLNNTFYKNFRTLEGQCNNEEHPLLGSTRSRLSRLLLADHEKFRKHTFFEKPRDLEYTKLDKKHCYPDRYGNYSTIQSAKIACLSDGNCQGVYDNGCNGKASGIHLCPTSATYSNSFGSCIYQKNENSCPEDDCNSACQKESDMLPNPRKLSTQVTEDIDRQDASLTLMSVIFGQFLDHELALSPEHEVEESCCEVPANGKTKDEECFEILVPPNDPFYSSLNQSCIHLTRSDPHSSSGWPPSIKREQQNIVTSFLDGSHVYGSTTERSKRLRSMVKGKLKVQNEYNLLPEENFRRCRVPIAGDERAMENPMLGSIHVLFVREHNRICDQLWTMIDWTQYGYPECDNDKCDELLYQNARRILIAEWQSIIYNEWLPLILGENRMSEFNLNLDSNSAYNNTIDPSILVSFATAAFRFGHSMVSGTFVKNSIANGNTVEQIVLSDSFFNADEYRKNGMEMTLAGLLTEKAQRMDRFVSTELTNFLFKDTDGPSKPRFGQDLISRNIARGRDHGLPGYAKFYETFGPQSDPNRFMKCWDERPQVFDSVEWNLMKEIYVHPKDIDLFVGGLLEKRMPNAGVLGPMFGYIVAEQFRRLKYGDRFFFTHKGNDHSFSSNFINSIKRRRLSDLLCDNTSIRKINKNAFLSTSGTMDCSQTNKLDFIHSNLLLPPTIELCSGAPTGNNRLWSPNVETVLKYKSIDLTSMLQSNQQLDQLSVPSPITMEADVKVQAFRDETLRVKFEHTKFYSQNEEVSVINAHRILDMISSQNGHGRHGAHTFKTSLEQPMMIQVKNGRAKDVLVTKNEPDCVSKMKVMLIKALMPNVENQELKIVKKESIVKPFEMAPSPKKINLSME